MYAITEYGARKITAFHFWVGKVHHKEPASPKTYQEFKENLLPGEKVIITANGEIYATRDTPGYCDGQKAVLSIQATPPAGMTLQEIKKAVDAGKPVFWKSKIYEVIKDKHGQYFIKCTANDYCTRLTHQDGETMNESEDDFFTPETLKKIN